MSGGSVFSGTEELTQQCRTGAFHEFDQVAAQQRHRILSKHPGLGILDQIFRNEASDVRSLDPAILCAARQPREVRLTESTGARRLRVALKNPAGSAGEPLWARELHEEQPLRS